MDDSEIDINITSIGEDVVIGTKEHPIVTRNANGDLQRRLEAERPQQLPTFVFWDDTLNEQQKNLVIEGINELYSSLHFDKNTIRSYGNWKSNKYLQNNRVLTPHESIQWAIQRNYNRNSGQIQAQNLVGGMLNDPYQTKSPHWEIIFTNHDLYTDNTKFVIGLAMPDLGTLISLHRFPGYEKTDFGREVIKTEIFHEIGHVFGLPSTRRGGNNLEDALGLHCKSDSCSMKQGMSVPDDWINITKRRIIKNQGPYCSECLLDLTKKK